MNSSGKDNFSSRPSSGEQIRFLVYELARDSRGRPSLGRLLRAPLRGASSVIIGYRLRRWSWLLLGRWAFLANTLLSPVFLWCRFLGGRHELPAEVEIGRGLFIAHPCRPIVIHRLARVGENLYLTGGNVIGVRRDIAPGELVIGDNFMLGIDGKVIGPLVIGNNVRVGAGSVVVKNLPDGVTAVGVPATIIRGATE